MRGPSPERSTIIVDILSHVLCERYMLRLVTPSPSQLSVKLQGSRAVRNSVDGGNGNQVATVHE